MNPAWSCPHCGAADVLVKYAAWFYETTASNTLAEISDIVPTEWSCLSCQHNGHGSPMHYISTRGFLDGYDWKTHQRRLGRMRRSRQVPHHLTVFGFGIAGALLLCSVLLVV